MRFIIREKQEFNFYMDTEPGRVKKRIRKKRIIKKPKTFKEKLSNLFVSQNVENSLELNIFIGFLIIFIIAFILFLTTQLSSFADFSKEVNTSVYE